MNEPLAATPGPTVTAGEYVRGDRVVYRNREMVVRGVMSVSGRLILEEPDGWIFEGIYPEQVTLAQPSSPNDHYLAAMFGEVMDTISQYLEAATADHPGVDTDTILHAATDAIIDGIEEGVMTARGGGYGAPGPFDAAGALGEASGAGDPPDTDERGQEE